MWNCWLYWTSSGCSYSFGWSVKTGVSRLRFSRTCCSQRRKKTEIVKAKGRLKSLAEKTDNGNALIGTCGIGHTRWATHGEPSETNAHPHMSDDGNVVGVHNGIIENYQELKEKLVRKGYSFYSSTDTEVAVKLIDYYYKKYEHTPVDAINHALVRIRGSYALAMMFQDYPGEIYVARKDSPMILGVTDGDCFVASDVPAILKYTRTVYYIGNLEMARMADGAITFTIWMVMRLRSSRHRSSGMQRQLRKLALNTL